MLGTALSVHMMEDYGFALFLMLPMVAGFVATLIYSIGRKITAPDAIGISILTGLLACSLLLLGGLEGIICVIMALPLVLPMTVVGGVIGFAVAHSVRSKRTRGMLCIAILPVWCMGLIAEPSLKPELPLRAVTTSVLIRADQQQVWDTVVRFPDITTEPDGVFRWGIAYPVSAELEGQGVGAIRRCSFSTGDFVEPITVWDEPNLLAFDVVENPLPMREWSFYGPIDTPHLHGIFESTRGQFKLIPAQDGWVELQGTTWYTQDLWPNAYWGFLADEIIHRIHLRVLNHIKEVVEGGNGSAG